MDAIPFWLTFHFVSRSLYTGCGRLYMCVCIYTCMRQLMCYCYRKAIYKLAHSLKSNWYNLLNVGQILLRFFFTVFLLISFSTLSKSTIFLFCIFRFFFYFCSFRSISFCWTFQVIFSFSAHCVLYLHSLCEWSIFLSKFRGITYLIYARRILVFVCSVWRFFFIWFSIFIFVYIQRR